MKKYIFGLIGIIGLGLINFSSAEITSVTCFDSDVEGYVECPFTISDYYSLLALSGNDVQWSSLYVNNNQITGSNSVYIYTPDFLEFDPDYKENYVDLVFQNVGDPEYIENVLSIQTYTPTSDEFALSFVGGLTLILPYILIVLFIIFIVKIIRKIFK